MAKILIADNDFYSCGFIYRILVYKSLGKLIETTHDGVCAYEKIVSGNFDVAIIDSDLSGLSGLKLVRKIKKERIRTNLIILSDRSSPALAAEAILSGAYDLIEKPILLDSFVYSIKKSLRDEQNKYEILHNLSLSYVHTFNSHIPDL